MPNPRRTAIAVAIAAALTLGSTSALVAPASAAESHVAASTVQAAAKSKVRTWAKKQYGTFKTWTRSGDGDDLLTLPKGIKAAVVTAKTDGESNFIVETLNKNNHMQDLLVNEIGTYTGTTVFGLESKSKARRLQIKADGSWKVVLKPISKAPALVRSHTGNGVYLFNKRAGAMRFTHSGSSNFIVVQHTGGRYGWNLLVNDIGHYKGTVPTEGGPSVIEVTADGHWTARFH